MSPQTVSEPLCIWNQVAPRVYTSIVLCFSLPKPTSEEALSTHLEGSLVRLSLAEPLFASRVAPSPHNPDKLTLLRDDGAAIAYSVINANISGIDYEAMKKHDFPEEVFIQPKFDLPGDPYTAKEPLPVVRVHAYFVSNGLFLRLCFHHSLFDGKSKDKFIEMLAAYTRSDPARNCIQSDTLHQNFGIPNSYGPNGETLTRLYANCSEYAALSSPIGPSQPVLGTAGTSIQEINKTARIFAFKKERIDELVHLLKSVDIEHRPALSTYSCLCALAFAYILKARDPETYMPESENETNPEPKFFHAINWKSNAFKDLPDDYIGNTVLQVSTKFSKSPLNHITKASSTIPWKIVAAIAHDISGSLKLTEDHVKQRLALFAAAQDVRHIGVDLDPRVKHNVWCVSWRHQVANHKWNLLGEDAVKPDAVRRTIPSPSLSHILFMPIKEEAHRQELLISLPEDSMKRLRESELMNWCHVIEFPATEAN
ncbi:hypothetical protein F5Y15DRAFT_424317 [Xylariaceae sp. FL0016]|nr:hypothetical protein F5Y15DRAFT_424317 [Xylariaceae sp. FL0016]